MLMAATDQPLHTSAASAKGDVRVAHCVFGERGGLLPRLMLVPPLAGEALAQLQADEAVQKTVKAQIVDPRRRLKVLDDNTFMAVARGIGGGKVLKDGFFRAVHADDKQLHPGACVL
jgi:hypothetical protein